MKKLTRRPPCIAVSLLSTLFCVALSALPAQADNWDSHAGASHLQNPSGFQLLEPYLVMFGGLTWQQRCVTGLRNVNSPPYILAMLYQRSKAFSPSGEMQSETAPGPCPPQPDSPNCSPELKDEALTNAYEQAKKVCETCERGLGSEPLFLPGSLGTSYWCFELTPEDQVHESLSHVFGCQVTYDARCIAR